uniref:Fc receptor-like protein 4 n=1 Tax=Lonchura striata TaxID=40157 RepID=UPI0012930986|nr:Fc receptor-like protein 4 [Lonchura striata domestica]
MAGDTGMARKVALLLWAQTLGLAGAQTTQLLVEPPWRPAVLWDQVTLTCQGLGTAGATTWYKDGQHWGHQGLIHVTVTESGNYTCDRPGSGHSRHVEVLDDQLVLQVPMRMLLEGDTVTLCCRYRQDNPVSSVFFYHEEKELVEFQNGTELFLSRLQLHHSGRYRCKGWVNSGVALGWEVSAPVTVTVHAPLAHISCPEPFPVPMQEGSPKTTEGSLLTLSCLSTPSPLHTGASLLHMFYQDGRVVWGLQGYPQLLVPTVGVSHSGNYSCEVSSESGAMRKNSTRLHVTVCSECGDGHGEPPQPPRVSCLVPVANATIALSSLAHQVRAGDPVTLRCSVQVGSAPVTFTWMHKGQEVAWGPLLELGDVDVGHSGTYQCVATNQLGQDGHRALSPKLVLEVTPHSPWLTGGVPQHHQAVQDPRSSG